jgi:hypothetical protein
MGRTIPAGRGIEDGMEVLHMLATSPATARFLSEKLCRKFVADHPPESLVDRCVKTWLETDGDIRLVLYRIFTSPEFLSEAAARTKMKTPFEFAMSAIRATGAETAAPRALLRRIGDLGEPLYFCEPPTGFADVADRWSGSNAVLSRLNFATALAFGRLPGVRVDTRGLSGDAPKDPDGLADWLVRRLLGCPLSPGSEAALTRTIEQAHSEAEGRSRRLPRSDAIGALAAMILGSPDFQMQ